MRIHGMAVQHERLSERGHEVYEPYPSPNVPTPQCVEWLLAASVFLIYVTLSSNLGLLHCTCIPIYSFLHNQRRSFLPQFYLKKFEIRKRCWKLRLECCQDDTRPANLLLSPNAAHMHPPQSPGQGPPPGPPGALSPGAPGPTDPIPVNQLNDMYMQQQQDISNRLEADGRGYGNLFSQ